MKKSSIVGMLALALASLAPTICRAAGGAEQEQNKEVAYLGVIGIPITPETAEKMGLDTAAGLRVVHVMKGSPADGVIKKNDILLKMGNQKLVDFRQFAALVHAAEPGDTVEFELSRDTAKTNVSVTLGAKKRHGGKMNAAKMEMFAPMFAKMMKMMKEKGGMEFEMDEAEFQKIMDKLKRHMKFHGDFDESKMPERFKKMKELLSSVVSTMETTDGVSISLKIDDGVKNLVIKDKEGIPVFDGPINTDEERSKVPERYRQMLDDLETTTTIENDGEGKVKIRVSVNKSEEEGDEEGDEQNDDEE